MTKHRASFPPPIFKSRVMRLRLLAESLGLRWVWDEFEVSGRYVPKGKESEVKQTYETK